MSQADEIRDKQGGRIGLGLPILSSRRAFFRLADTLGVSARDRYRATRLSQSGSLRQGPESSWIPFKAEQTISAIDCAFDWRARAGTRGLIQVHDALHNGAGTMGVRLLGVIPVFRLKNSPEAAKGELMRYLAELPWCPDAILQNPHLECNEEASGDLTVTATFGHVSASVKISLDSNGRVRSVFAPRRPRAIEGGFIPTPWFGHFSDYRFHNGRCIPFRASVGWIINGSKFLCWRGEVLSWDPEP